MNDLNLTNMKLLHHFCLKHSKIGQICMRGGPFISSHPVKQAFLWFVPITVIYEEVIPMQEKPAGMWQEQ